MKVKTLKVSSLAVMATPAACTLSSCSDTTSTINIVGLNDFHGNVSAYHNYDDAYESRIACIADKYQQIRKNREDKTELILIGDNSDRSAIGQFSDQRAPVNLLSNLDIKYSVFGNHEGYLDPDIYFNPLSESDLTKWGKFRSYLACNNYWYGGQYQQAIYCDYFKPYAIEHIGDLNVGIVAYSAANTTTTTPSTKGLYCADATDDTTIFGNTGKTGAQILQESIDACRNDSLNLNNGIKPDVVILAQHEGIAPDNSGQWDTNSGSFKVISKISGVDASFDAHTHFHYNLEAKDKTGKSIPVAQGQPYGQSLSNLTISYNKKKTKFNFSFQDEPINEQTDIGQLENKDTAMVKDTKASLQKWYDYVINEEGETLQEKINTELGDFKIDEKNKDKELVFPYDTLPNEVFSRGGHLVVDAYLDMFDTSKSIPSTTVDAALDEINTKFGENEIAGSIINRFNFSSSLIPSKGLGTTTRAATVADFFDLSSFNDSTWVLKLTVKEINGVLTDWYNRGYETQIFKFKDYLVNWDKSSGKPYVTADEVWLVDKQGNKVDETKSLLMIGTSYFMGNVIKYNTTWTESEIQQKKLELTEPTDHSETLVKELYHWGPLNMFSLYIKKYLKGTFDVTKYHYDENEYLYLK